MFPRISMISSRLMSMIPTNESLEVQRRRKKLEGGGGDEASVPIDLVALAVPGRARVCSLPSPLATSFDEKFDDNDNEAHSWVGQLALLA